MARLRVLRKLKRAILRDDPGFYDMFANPGERYFARLYLSQIQGVMESEGLGAPLEVLDAGCQAGRLAIPLAAAGHRVTGVDTTGVGLRRAERHARENGTSLRLIRADLARWLPGQPEGSFDAVVCAEVLYLRRNYRELLEGLIRLLKPGGLCFISHRPPVYYLVEALQKKDWEAARLILSASEGAPWGEYYNWQRPEELEALYGSLGVKVLAIMPIGLLSWLAVNPEGLEEPALRALAQADAACAQEAPALGRYLLVSGKRCQAPPKRGQAPC